MFQSRKITTLVTDILGTVLGKHCLVLDKPLIDAFAKHGVSITREEARRPTGISKISHIREILTFPSVINRNKTSVYKFGSEKDTQDIFDLYKPLQLEALSDPESIRPLPGVIQTLQQLKEMGIKIGVTTGFDTAMMNVIINSSKENIGQYFDHVVPCDHPFITRGRPCPDGVFINMMALHCDHVQSCIKADDTKSGLLEGINGGVNTLAVTRYSNLTGLYTEDIDELEKVNKKEYLRIMTMATRELEEVKPTFLCESLVGLVPLIKLRNSKINHPEVRVL